MIYSDKLKFDLDFIDPYICNSWVAAAIGGSALLSAGSSIFGASRASDAQTSASERAAATNMQMYERTRGDLAPFRAVGEQAAGEMGTRLKDLTSPISVNPDDFQNSDYFKFAMNQGQRAVTNSAAARGLASSGAALKGAAAFAKGLATDTYKTAFDMANTNQTNAYDRLLKLIQSGTTAAGATGSAGSTAATNTGNAQIGAGNAQAAGWNAMGGAVGNAGRDLGGYAAYKGLYGSGGGSGPITYGGPNGPVAFS